MAHLRSHSIFEDLAAAHAPLVCATVATCMGLAFVPYEYQVLSALFAFLTPAFAIATLLSFVAYEMSNPMPKHWQSPVSRRKKRVAIIGAGPSGIATAREVLAEGHEVVVFEYGNNIGGAFATAYCGAKLTSSNYITAFSTMQPKPGAAPTHWTAGEYCQYLERYCEKFDITDRIRFETKVESVRREVSGKWVVRSHPLNNETKGASHSVATSEQFDAVAVCCGTHQKAAYGSGLSKKLEGFDGKIIHSSMYKTSCDLSSSRVLIVGLGESGSDISLQAAKVAKAVAISTRSGPGYVIPRRALGSVADLETSRAHHSIHQGRLGWSRTMRTDIQLRLKLAVENFVSNWWFCPKHPGEPEMKALKLADEINRKIGLPWYRRFGTKNMAFCSAIVDHGAMYKPDILEARGSTVTFVDGTSFEADTIVLCTGYRVAFSFLQSDLASRCAGIRRDLYKHMIHPSVGSSLAFVGFCRPGVGSIPPLSEMQARYWALLLSGKRSLPSQCEMTLAIAHDDAKISAQYPRDAKRLSSLCDFLRLMDDLAGLIVCRPPLFDVRHPIASFKVLFGPITGAQFRLIGPGAMPWRSREVLFGTPTSPLPLVIFNLLNLIYHNWTFFILLCLLSIEGIVSLSIQRALSC
eukprot:g1389.t1